MAMNDNHSEQYKHVLIKETITDFKFQEALGRPMTNSDLNQRESRPSQKRDSS